MKDSIIDKKLPLFIPHSSTTTAVNKTGSWRFFHPKYEEKTAPCSAACPVGQDIPRIEMLAARGQLKDAWQTILSENPFPAVCGRVCFHPCEGVCNRAGMDDPIAIHHLERFLGDASISPYVFFPFGAGSRICIGQNLSGAITQSFLKCVHGKLKFALVDLQEPALKTEITLRPKKPIIVKVQRAHSGTKKATPEGMAEVDWS